MNDKTFSRVRSIQNKKCSNFILENSNLISKILHNSEKVIFNFSSHGLNDDEKSLLFKGLKFSIPPEHLHCPDHVLPFELLFGDIKKIEKASEDKEFMKSRLKDSPFTSFWSYNYNSKIDLTKD